MKHLIVITALTLAAATGAAAQKRLSQPLHYVAADSVVVWGQGYDDLRGMAMGVDATLTPQPFCTVSTGYRQQLKAWQRRRADFSLTGVRPQRAGDAPALAATDALDAAVQLFRLNGNGELMDAAEQLLYNALYHEAIAVGPLNYAKHCAAQALVDAMGYVYATDGHALWVNLYVNSTTHVATDNANFIVDQLTQMPFGGRVRLRLTAFPHNGYPLTLHLRLPQWAQGHVFPQERYRTAAAGSTALSTTVPTIYINGRAALKTVITNGYITITRQWNRGDEVYFDLPLTPTIVSSTDNAPMLMRGPLVYHATTATFPLPLSEDTDATGIPRFVSATDTTFCAVPYFLPLATQGH